MRRLLLVSCSAVGLLALLPVSGAARRGAAGAQGRPVGDEGAERRVAVPEMTMQQCTDETTDKDMSTAMSPMAKEMCSKQDIQKTSAGYVTDSVCGIAGMTIKSKAEITGDFNSAYTVKSTSHSEGGTAGAPRDSTRRSRPSGSAPARPTRRPATS